MSLNERTAYYTRILDDGRVVDVVPLTFGRARIVVSDSLESLAWSDGW